MNQRLVKAALLSVTAVSLLAASMSSNARAIRIDGAGGGGAWTVPETSSDGSMFVDDIGFAFNFFGIATTSLTINANGSVSFGGAVIAPFLDGTQTNSFSYSLTNEELVPGIPDAIRIQWGSIDDFGNVLSDNLFQLAIFNLADDVFAMEFNYGQITAGSDDSGILFDNGDGTSFDLLEELGLGFDQYMGIGADGDVEETAFCDPPSETILACNNFNALTGQFGPDAADVLPSNFGGFFQVDPTSVLPAQGRYFFLVDNSATDPSPVPEPATLWLLGIGFAGFAISRRRRSAITQTP